MPVRTADVNCSDHDAMGPACRAKVHAGRPSPGTCHCCAERRPIDADKPALLSAPVDLRVYRARRAAAASPPAEWLTTDPPKLRESIMAHVGPGLWKWIHDRPWKRRRKPRRELQRLWRFSLLVPCGRCRGHLRRWLRTLTAADIVDRERLFRRSWELHETVNKAIGKPSLALADARAMHGPSVAAQGGGGD